MTCRDCIAGHFQTYELQNSVKITVEGGDLGGLATFSQDGRVWEAPVPDAALPDCENCPKPELDEVDVDAYRVFMSVQSQQQRSAMSGHLYGIRYEALSCALRDYQDEGGEHPIAELRERVLLLDSIFRRQHNARVEAQQKAKSR